MGKFKKMSKSKGKQAFKVDANGEINYEEVNPAFKKIFDDMQAANDKWSNGGVNFVSHMTQIDNNYTNHGWTPEEYYEASAQYKKHMLDD